MKPGIKIIAGIGGATAAVVVLLLWRALPSSEDGRKANRPDHHTPLQVEPNVGIGTAKFGMKREAVLRTLGDPDQADPRGTNLIYSSRGFSLNLSPVRGLTFINCYASFTARFAGGKDFAGKTKEGITMGAKESAVIAAYGEPTERNQNRPQSTLVYDRLGSEFHFFDGSLVQMTFRSPSASAPTKAEP